MVSLVLHLLINSIIFFIQKFEVTHWPNEDYGKFYEGDSYIILNVSIDAKNPHASLDVSSRAKYNCCAFLLQI